jgi:hypothetical protein
MTIVVTKSKECLLSAFLLLKIWFMFRKISYLCGEFWNASNEDGRAVYFFKIFTQVCENMGVVLN